MRPRYTPVVHSRLLERRGKNRVTIQQHIQVPRVVQEVILDAAPECWSGESADGRLYVSKWSEHGVTKGTFKSSRSVVARSVDGYGGYPNIGRFHHVRDTGASSYAMGKLMTERPMSLKSILPYHYDQYDLDNAMPHVILHHFKHLRLPVIEERVAEIDGLSKTNPSRPELKYHLYRNLNMTSAEPDPEVHAEALRIKAEFEEMYPGFVSVCKQKRLAEGKDPALWFSVALQLFYEDFESEIQLKVSTALKKEYGLPEYHFIHCDAVFVIRCMADPDAVLDTINAVVAPYDIRYSRVPVDHSLLFGTGDYTGEQLEEEIRTALMSTRDDFKTKIEQDCFALLSASKFVMLDHATKTFTLKTKRELEDVNYAQYVGDKSDPGPLDLWFRSPDRLTYDRIVNKPPPLETLDGEFNLWDFQGGFRAAQLPDVPDDYDSGSAVQTIISCFRRLVGNEEAQLEYLLNYMACQLQEPARKVQQYVAFYGGQGTGKTELIVNFWGRKMLGENNYVEYADFQQFFEKHEVGWVGKSAIMINEVEHGDFSANYRRLKAFTGTISVKANEKNQSIISVENYSRIFMTSNCINAFAEKDTTARRAGLRAAGYHFRDIEGALETLRSDHAQRAFYDFLMARDISAWEPERDRLDSALLADSNNRIAFFAHTGKEALVTMACILDRAYQILGEAGEHGARLPQFAFPVQMLARALEKNNRFNENKSRSQWENIATSQLAAAIHDLGKEGMQMPDEARRYLPFRPKSGKGAKLRLRVRLVDYLVLKHKLEEMAAEQRWEDVIDMDDFTTKALEGVEAWVAEVLERYDHTTLPTSAPANAQMSAHRVGSQYEVRKQGSVVLLTGDLEEVNKAMGEAYVGEYTDPETGKEFRVLHHQRIKKDLELNDWYSGDHWATKVELRFPFYVRDRTA